MKNLFLSFIVLFGMLSTSIQAQEKVYLPFFDEINMGSTKGHSATKIYKVFLEEAGRFQAVMSEFTDSTAEIESPGHARENADARDIPYYIIGTVNKMGESIVVSVTLYNSSDGRIEWSAVERAGSLEDVSIILEKMAKITGTNEKMEDVTDVTNKTDYASRKRKSRKLINNFGFTVGSTYPILDLESEKLAGGLGVMYSMDAGNLIFDLKAEGYFQPVNEVLFTAIDANYVFSKKPNSFFASAGLGYGRVTYTGYNPYDNDYQPWNSYFWGYFYRESGSMVFLGGGYLLNRDARVRLRVGLKAFYSSMAEIEDGTLPNPAGAIFTTTLLFH